jgi:hypothetical protein
LCERDAGVAARAIFRPRHDSRRDHCAGSLTTARRAYCSLTVTLFSSRSSFCFISACDCVPG